MKQSNTRVDRGIVLDIASGNLVITSYTTVSTGFGAPASGHTTIIVPQGTISDFVAACQRLQQSLRDRGIRR